MQSGLKGHGAEAQCSASALGSGFGCLDTAEGSGPSHGTQSIWDVLPCVDGCEHPSHRRIWEGWEREGVAKTLPILTPLGDDKN